MKRLEDGTLDVQHIHKLFQKSIDKTAEWREEAERALEFVAGEQYLKGERVELDLGPDGELKIPVTFNRTEIYVNAVCGLEVLNREEVKYIPRKAGSVGVTDVITDAARYFNDEADTEVAHSESFRELVATGMGWSEVYMTYDDNPDGELDVIQKSPLRMFWDWTATQRNLADSKWRLNVEPMLIEKFDERWPGKRETMERSNAFQLPNWGMWGEHRADQAWKYEHHSQREDDDGDAVIWVVQLQFWESEHYYRIATREGVTDITVEQYNSMPPEAKESLRAVKSKRKRHKKAFIAGNTVLDEMDNEVDGFTLLCMTGKYERKKNTWYGLTRGLFDPQIWLNKLFSTILYILATNAKGGLLAEEDAFSNIHKAQEDWSKPDRIIFVNPGGLQKIKERGQAQYPQGMDRLMQVTLQMFSDVTGANLELLGLAEKVQPGILEHQRKQAGMTILSWAFDSLRSYRKQYGRIMAKYIQDHLSDGRLVKIVTEGGEKFIPLVRDELTQEYDVIVSSSPRSENERERVFAIISQLIPQLMQMGIPIPSEVLDYTPLPVGLVEAWKNQIAEQGENPEADRMKDLAQRKVETEIGETASKTVLNIAKSDSERRK